MESISSVTIMNRSPAFRHRFLQVLGITALAVAAPAALVFGYSAASPVPAAEPPATAAAPPSGFADRFGYRPVVVDGRRENPGGSCSSPVPLPRRFEPACRAHDYGYDLLRYAEAAGTGVRPGARARLDAELIGDMHRRCTNPLCHAAAEMSRVGLAVNTWRQRGQAPHPESGLEIAASLAARATQTLAGRP